MPAALIYTVKRLQRYKPVKPQSTKPIEDNGHGRLPRPLFLIFLD